MAVLEEWVLEPSLGCRAQGYGACLKEVMYREAFLVTSWVISRF